VRSYAEREVFSPHDLSVLRLATRLVSAVGDHWGNELRCHELARAAAARLRDVGIDCTVVDGAVGVIEHSWVRIEASSAILDVYCPGRLPQVQLIHAHRHVSLGYEPGEDRGDVREAILGRLREEMQRARMRDTVTVREVVAAVAQCYGVQIVDVLSSRRYRRIAAPRAVAMYLARRHTGRSYPELARAFGRRCHTTVISAVQKVAERASADEILRCEISAIEEQLLRCAVRGAA